MDRQCHMILIVLKIVIKVLLYNLLLYCNDPKFSDRQAWAISADPDQTVPRGAV